MESQEVVEAERTVCESSDRLLDSGSVNSGTARNRAMQETVATESSAAQSASASNHDSGCAIEPKETRIFKRRRLRRGPPVVAPVVSGVWPIRQLISRQLAGDLLEFARDVRTWEGFREQLRLAEDFELSVTSPVESISNAYSIKLDPGLYRKWVGRNPRKMLRVTRLRDQVLEALSSNSAVHEANTKIFGSAANLNFAVLQLLLFQRGALPQLPHADADELNALVVNTFLDDGDEATEVVLGLPDPHRYAREGRLESLRPLLDPRGEWFNRFVPAINNVGAGDAIAMPVTQVHRGPGCPDSRKSERVVLFAASSPYEGFKKYDPAFQIHPVCLAQLISSKDGSSEEKLIAKVSGRYQKLVGYDPRFHAPS